MLFSGLAFFLLLPLMKRTLTISLDTDWIWRVALAKIGSTLRGAFEKASGAIGSDIKATVDGLFAVTRRYFGPRQVEEEQPRGVFAQSWTIGTTALWVAALLTGYMLAYFN